VVAWVRPKKTPLASGSLCGVRSPTGRQEDDDADRAFDLLDFGEQRRFALGAGEASHPGEELAALRITDI